MGDPRIDRIAARQAAQTAATTYFSYLAVR